MQKSNANVAVVKEDSEIEITFNLSLIDGTVVEETADDETFRFRIGDGTFVQGLEEMLIGLEIGTTAKLMLSPERAYGLSDPENRQTMSRADFPADMPLQVGHVIGFDSPTGDEIPGTVEAVDADSVVIDFNHPLADATVVFTATIKAIYP